MKTTITERFNADGKLVERITVTEDMPHLQRFQPKPYPPPIIAPKPPWQLFWEADHRAITP